MNLTKLLAVATAAAALTCAFVACDDHDDDGHTHGSDKTVHDSPYPTCKAIIEVCHEVDTGEETPMHACHDKAHDAKSDSDCTPIKDNCLQVCKAAAADGGHAEHEDHDAGDADGGT